MTNDATMPRGNDVAGKVQRSIYITEELAEALLRAATEETIREGRKVTQSVIVERALRKELGMDE